MDSQVEIFKQEQLPEQSQVPVLPFVPVPGGATLKEGEFRSPNYVKASQGWKIASDGSAEFQDVTIGSSLNIDFSLTAGTALTQNDAVSFSPNVTLYDNIVTTAGDVNIGDSTADDTRAEQFTATVNSTTAYITLRVKKVGSPSALRYKILADAAGVPVWDATGLGSADLAAASASTSYTDISLLITGLTLVAGTQYWIAFSNTAVSGANYWVLARDSSGSHQLRDGGTGNWSTDSSGDLIAKGIFLGGTGVANTVYKSSALISDSVNKLLGIATKTVAAGSPVVIRSDGKVTTFTGLTATSTYYLSDTNGAISTSAGTTTKIIGRAMSTTDLQVKYSL